MSCVQCGLPVLASRQWNRPLKSATNSRSSLIATVPQVRCIVSSNSILPLLVLVVRRHSARRRPSSGFGRATSPSALFDRLQRGGAESACFRSLTLKASSGLTSPRLVGSMHHKWPDAFAVLRIFAHADVDQAVVNHRRADDVVAIVPGRRGRTSIPWDCSRTSRAASACRPWPCRRRGSCTASRRRRRRSPAARRPARHRPGDDHWPCSMFVPGELSVQMHLAGVLVDGQEAGGAGARAD